jgi:hypothetical protein
VKITVGGAVATDLQSALEKKFRQEMRAETIRLSKPRLEKLAAQLQFVAERETEQLFPVIVMLIERARGDVLSGPELTYEDLMQGAGTLVGGPPSYVSSAPMEWKPLRLSYYDQKVRYYRNADNMFLYFGDLRRYFARYGDSIVRSRMGGVNVKLDIPEIEDTLYFSRGREDNYKNLILGNLTVTVFPNLAPALLGMMKGRSWNDMTGQEGQFEEQLFEGTDTVIHKLMNRPHTVKTTGVQSANQYRPLVLPAVQFWIQVRIPNAILRALKDFTQRAAIRGKT